ncbi:MAG: hypothetical protein IKE43_03970 [Coriobacteriales bacterium]|nr:hypothetical protein [Coriobacteriales bacterium]
MWGFRTLIANRITSTIMGLMLVALVLFSSFYLVAEANHDCSGEDCPICECIQQCIQTLQQIGEGAVSLTAAVIPAFACLILVFLPVTLLPQNTLVSNKVRLNN